MRELQWNDHTTCRTEHGYSERRDRFYPIATQVTPLVVIFCAGFLIKRYGLVTEPIMMAGAFLVGIVAPGMIMDIAYGQPFIRWIRDNFFALDRAQPVVSKTDQPEKSVEPEESIEPEAEPARLTGMPDPFKTNQLLH